MNREQERIVREYERIEEMALAILRARAYRKWTAEQKIEAYNNRREAAMKLMRDNPDISAGLEIFREHYDMVGRRELEKLIAKV